MLADYCIIFITICWGEEMTRIKTLRLRQNLRQVDLAGLLKTTQQSIARYESGDREPDLATIHRLCDIFGVTADYLLGRSENPAPAVSDADAALLAAFHAAPPSIVTAISALLQPYQQESAADRAG